MIDWTARAKARFQTSATDETDVMGVSSVSSGGSEGLYKETPEGFVGFVGTQVGVHEETVQAHPGLPEPLRVLVDRLNAAGALAQGDDDLIADMHQLDPEGTAWLLRDMLLRAARA